MGAQNGPPPERGIAVVLALVFVLAAHALRRRRLTRKDMASRLEEVRAWLLKLQDRISETFGAEDPAAALAGGGGDRTRVLAGGEVIERGGANLSQVHGDALPPAATVHRPELAGRGFQALGVSVVVHPLNPCVPASHCNVRYLVAEAPGEAPVWWLGGGFELPSHPERGHPPPAK